MSPLGGFPPCNNCQYLVSLVSPTTYRSCYLSFCLALLPRLQRPTEAISSRHHQTMIPICSQSVGLQQEGPCKSAALLCVSFQYFHSQITRTASLGRDRSLYVYYRARTRLYIGRTHVMPDAKMLILQLHYRLNGHWLRPLPSHLSTAAGSTYGYAAAERVRASFGPRLGPQRPVA